jgi:hypothetical protein
MARIREQLRCAKPGADAPSGRADVASARYARSAGASMSEGW